VHRLDHSGTLAPMPGVIPAAALAAPGNSAAVN
jgi:hypothetical protein